MKQKLEPLTYSQYCILLSKENSRHCKKVKKLISQLFLFQKTCKHEKTRFEPDPTGGNDSYYYCIICARKL
jgi:hypothetical protein